MSDRGTPSDGALDGGGGEMRTKIGFCGSEILCNVFSYLGCLNMNMAQMGVCPASLSLFFLFFLLVGVNGRDFPLVVIRYFPLSGLRCSICSYICVCTDCSLFIYIYIYIYLYITVMMTSN